MRYIVIYLRNPEFILHINDFQRGIVSVFFEIIKLATNVLFFPEEFNLLTALPIR